MLRFAERLKAHFGRRLVRVIALPSPDQEVYEPNVLVLLDKYDSRDVDIVVKLASEVDERINPLIASVDERDEDTFLHAGGRDVQTD